MNYVCQICYEDFKAEGVLKCDHHYCQSCLLTSIAQQIASNISLKCPGCFTELLIEDLKYVIPQQYDDLLQRLMKKGYIEGLSKNEKLVQCLNDECNNQFIIWADADYQSCHVCKKKHCRKCNQLFHAGQTCSQSRDRGILTASLADFIIQSKSAGMKECPNCFTLIAKISGCNFMTCQSKICEGKSFFCWECSSVLSYDDHFTHYRDRRYNSVGQCLKKVDGKWVEPDVKQTIHEATCPCCYSTSLNSCKVEMNLGRQIVQCNSDRCKGKYYCTLCRKELNDKLLLKHLGKDDCTKRCTIF